MSQNADFAATTPWRGILNKPDVFATLPSLIGREGANNGDSIVWNNDTKRYEPRAISGAGENGWSPQFAIVTDGSRRVLQVVSWTGGGGVPPSSPVYVGSTGFTTNIALAIDIRGASGAAGTPGSPGAPGSVWYEGTGVPAGGLGINGDFYLRTSNGDVYTKAAGAWSVIGNITGPMGPAGGSVGVRTRADLRAYTGMVNKQFLGEEGYSFQGDGGGGIWFFVSNDNYSIDNDGTLVVPGGVRGDPATVGCWHRVGPGTQGNSIVPATTLDVRWFGAIPDRANDVTPGILHAFEALNFAAAQQSGTLYAPAGFYKFATKCVLDMANQGGTLTIKGDGPGSTVFVFGFGTTDTAMLEIKNGTKLNVMDLSCEWVDYSPTVDSARVFWFHDFAIATITCVDGLGLGGDFFNFETVGQLNVSNCVTQNRDGTQLAIGKGGNTKGCGGTVENCSFGVAGTAGPCFWIPNCNSIQLVGNFFAGGGPWKKFTGATITSTGSDFTVNKTAHGFVVGEYIVLSGAAHAGYNRFWRVATVPTANSLTVTSTLNLGSDTVTLATLTACGLFGAGASGSNATESFVASCFFNTGGSPGSGSVGLWLEAMQTNNVAEIGISDCIFDFGNCAIFCHGLTNSDPASSCHQISISNCRPNGGPRDEFGAFRFEGVTTATLDGLRAFPGNNAPPATGITFNTVVVCDGGQANKTQDISITGGTATNKNSTALYPGATIQAFVFDGANVHNVSVQNVGIDAAQTVASFINSATSANGITVMYADNAGRVQLIDSTGTHAL